MRQQKKMAGGIAAALIGLAMLWLQQANAQTVTVPAQPRMVTVPVLQLVLSPHEKVINAGGTMQIDALITNTGDGTATGVVLKVSAPEGIRFTPLNTRGRWEVPTIPAGMTKTVALTISADQALQAGSVTLKASTSADGVAAVSDTSTVEVKRGAVKGATTNGAETLTELPKTGASTIPLWIGIALFAVGITGLYRSRTYSIHPR